MWRGKELTMTLTRYDYDPVNHRVAFRGSPCVPTRMAWEVKHAIHLQLRSISEGSDTAASFAKNVRGVGSATQLFPVPGYPTATRSRHDPDFSFLHIVSRSSGISKYPGVIMEFSESDKTNLNKKDVEHLARKYIRYSKGAVRAVVCVEITYSKDEDGKKEKGKAELSVWRP
ncbi:hypothetical protein BU24DRAFT_207351 [Aaosphaeria arxii CBS 175.79]|uniref:Uncharacterized protein n=1 Tax=Aaosphaeria arxii CBS 175.79 TaxID=1450172 RepID=A0A6A5XTM0_9PLEO|nr:uncharacterized protein BU24DRAFT_207351 [Aaosphaeria arxii CBS 175.79]KAF2016648.1 hypothetical protein BU24DRAFT_207351 [Aaosphaeria arxii CBS 175.79]